PEARTGRHVRPEALPRAVLELRQRARARHSRADARGLTASERALRAPTPAETSELDRELHERLPAEVVVAAVERRVAVAEVEPLRDRLRLLIEDVAQAARDLPLIREVPHGHPVRHVVVGCEV